MRLNLKHFKIIEDGENKLSITDIAESKLGLKQALYMSPYDTEGELILPELRKSKALLRVLNLLETNGYAFMVEKVVDSTEPTKLIAGVTLLKGKLIDGKRYFTVGL